MPFKRTTLGRTSSNFTAQLPSRRFIAAIITLGGVQLMATMDGTIVIVALPKMQNELDMSDAGRSWVITAYVLTYGALLLVGGRLGDTMGLKRIFVIGVAIFTLASAVCGIAQDGGTLIAARLLQGVAAAILAPTSMALVATTFPKGPVRNVAVAVFGVLNSLSSVLSLVAGGALAGVSWRLLFLVNVPLGLLVVYLGRTALQETRLERIKLDVAGAGLATLTCIAAVVAVSAGPERGWLSPVTIGSGVLALVALGAFIVVERTAQNPIVPFDLFIDRNRVATFATLFLAGGVVLAMTVLVTLYVQNIMGYSPLRTGAAFIPFVLGAGVGMATSARLATRFPPRMLVIAGGMFLLVAMFDFSTLHSGAPYFPNLVVPLMVGGFGLGVADVPVSLSVIADLRPDRVGPTSAVALMLYTIGGPVAVAIIQAIVTSRTLHLGGTSGPPESMNAAQLSALEHGYTYGMLWLAGIGVLVGGVALFIGYTAAQVAHAQEIKKAMDAGDL